MTAPRGYYDQSYPPSIYGPPPVKDPHITSLVPATSVVDVEVVVTVNGRDFEPTSVIEVDQAAFGATAYVSPTVLTATVTPTVTGTKRVTVRNDNDEESNGVDYIVTAATEEPEAVAAATTMAAADAEPEPEAAPAKRTTTRKTK